MEDGGWELLIVNSKLEFEMIYLIVLTLLILAFFLDAERDTIQFRPHESWFPNWKFWVTKYNGDNKLLKTVLVFTQDGWHLTKTLYLWSLFTAVGLLFCNAEGISLWFTVPIVLVLWFLNGVIFESTYS